MFFGTTWIIFVDITKGVSISSLGCDMVYKNLGTGKDNKDPGSLHITMSQLVFMNNSSYLKYIMINSKIFTYMYSYTLHVPATFQPWIMC